MLRLAALCGVFAAAVASIHTVLFQNAAVVIDDDLPLFSVYSLDDVNNKTANTSSTPYFSFLLRRLVEADPDGVWLPQHNIMYDVPGEGFYWDDVSAVPAGSVAANFTGHFPVSFDHAGGIACAGSGHVQMGVSFVDVAAITDWSNITLPEGESFGLDDFDVRISLKSTGWPFCSPNNMLLARYFLTCSGCGNGNQPDGTPSNSGADFSSRSGTTVSVAVNTTAKVDGSVDNVGWTAVSPQKALSIYEFEFPNFKESMDHSHMLRISLKQPPTITASPTPSVKPRWPPDDAATKNKATPLPELTMVIIILSGFVALFVVIGGSGFILWKYHNLRMLNSAQVVPPRQQTSDGSTTSWDQFSGSGVSSDRGLVGQRRPRWGADPPTHGMSLAERFEMYMAARAQQRGSSSGSSPPFAVSNSPESGSGSGTGDGSTSHPALEYKMTGLSDVCLGDDEVPMQTPDLIGQSMPLTITHAPPAPPEAV